MMNLIILWVLSPSAYAYLDPGSGYVALQALFAGVVGFFALLKIYWQQFKAWVQHFFIKPNKDVQSIPSPTQDEKPKDASKD